MVLPFNTFMPDGNKRSYIPTQNQQLNNAGLLSWYGILVPPTIKQLIRFMFMAILFALQVTIKNKIKRLVAHY